MSRPRPLHPALQAVLDEATSHTYETDADLPDKQFYIMESRGTADLSVVGEMQIVLVTDLMEANFEFQTFNMGELLSWKFQVFDDASPLVADPAIMHILTQQVKDPAEMVEVLESHGFVNMSKSDPESLEAQEANIQAAHEMAEKLRANGIEAKETGDGGVELDLDEETMRRAHAILGL